MIKRRFFKVDHDDNDGGSDSSSSDSEPELQPEVAGESDGDDGDDEEDVGEAEAKVDPESPSSSSGYESEDSSVNEVGADSSGLSVNEEDDESGTRLPLINDTQLSSRGREDSTEPKGETLEEEKDPIPADALEYILCSKSVYKCRICPRVVCLKEETLKTHLKSQKHARSEKLLKEGRLKAMLNSDGEIEHQETAAEMHARVVAMAQNLGKRKNKGRQRQRSRKKKIADDSNVGNAKQPTKSPAKKQRKK